MKLPTYFISHGGGPCFDMAWPDGNPFATLRTYFEGFAASVPERPRAILIVSGHWETRVVSVTSGTKPALIYDYTNFPPHTYALRYDAPGSPELASRVRGLLAASDITSKADDERGFDHGVFVPMRVMYPDADIPVVQLSLELGYDPARHLAIGEALAPLRDEGVLIVGSGMSYHNMRRMRDEDSRDAARFDAWLTSAVTHDAATRPAALVRWADAPSAREAHPEEDHLAPLFVAAGAGAGERGERVYHDLIAQKPISGYRFG